MPASGGIAQRIADEVVEQDAQGVDIPRHYRCLLDRGNTQIYSFDISKPLMLDHRTPYQFGETHRRQSILGGRSG